MKKRNLTTMTALVLLFVMISVALISGTLAKYATEFDGTDTVTVAKWRVSVRDLASTEYTAGSTFNLFEKSKIFDLDELDPDDLSGEDIGTRETDVKEGKLIAPGTWGKVGFQVVVDDENEVTVVYGINVTEVTNEDNIPLQFSLDGKNWVDDVTTLSFADQTVTVAQLAEGDVTRTATLYWRWLYEREIADVNQDPADTTLGTKTTPPTYTIKATFGARQAD